jgi:hypothetical protein
MQERGLSMDHTTVRRWVQNYVPGNDFLIPLFVNLQFAEEGP